MDETDVTYHYDVHADNHDYDDNLDDRDNNNGVYARVCKARLSTSVYRHV